jgi:hypothetical protein
MISTYQWSLLDLVSDLYRDGIHLTPALGGCFVEVTCSLTAGCKWLRYGIAAENGHVRRMSTGQKQPPWCCHRATELLRIWKSFHITRPIALRDMWVSSPVGAAYMENVQHHSRNPGFILQVFRHHGQWQVTA